MLFTVFGCDLTSQHGAPSDESFVLVGASRGDDRRVGPAERQNRLDVHGYRVVAGAVEQRLADEVRCVTL